MTGAEWEERRQQHLARLREEARLKWERGEKAREDRAKGCLNKVGYLSQGLAAVAAQQWMTTNDTERMALYRCAYGCGCWHMTRQVAGASKEGYLVVERDPETKTPDELKIARKKRAKARHDKRRATQYENYLRRMGKLEA
jgi:hypothetical protein